jgi:hypothetical protein
MSTCAIRYRLDAGGPAVFVVEASDGFHFYSHGQLGPAIPGERLPMLLSSRTHRWVQATGHVTLTDRPTAHRTSPPESSFEVQHEPASELGAMLD